VRLRAEIPNNDRRFVALVEGLEGGTGLRLMTESFRFLSCAVNISELCFDLVSSVVAWFPGQRRDEEDDWLVIAVKLETVRGLNRLMGGKRNSRKDLERPI
jgi:hypothetical protein